MASKVSICNQALQKIKVDEIMSLSEDSKQGRDCNLLFDDLLDEALTIRAWNFATTMAELGQLVTAPLAAYTYKYQLPTDCLQVLEIVEDSKSGYGIEYKVEGRTLLTDESSVIISYIKKITDMSELSPLFRAYITTKLAYELAFTLTGAVSIKDRLEKEMESKLRSAKLADSMEISPRMVVKSKVIDIRYTRGYQGGR